MRDAVGCERTDGEDDRYTKERRKSWMRNVRSVKADARRRWMRYGGRLDWQGNEKETKNLAEDSEKVGSRMCNAVGWGRRDGGIDRDRKERRK